MAKEVLDFYKQMLTKTYKDRVPTPDYIKSLHKKTVGKIGDAMVGLDKKSRTTRRRRFK